ncbi:MAG: redox-regulated ATPase YchF [Deltaproteobacteria bacterium]|nr:MAG: redox-regulated ATPase YchF [Deltaproteobacteria bacterium]
MRIGIIGLPLSGKTTLFEALTGTAPEEHKAGRQGPDIKVVKVMDDRVTRLAEMYQPKKVTYAEMEYLDFAGIVKDGEKGEMDGSFLKSIGKIDAFVHVVRAFPDSVFPHPLGKVDPLRDVERFHTDLILSDLAIVEKRLERLQKDLKRGLPVKEELALLERCRDALEAETFLNQLDFGASDRQRLKGFDFLTMRPMIVALNVHENQLGTPEVEELGKAIEEAYPFLNESLFVVAAKIEMEIAQLSQEDAAVFLEDLGIEESAMDRLIHLCYRKLGRISFFTVGKDEVKAWTIPEGLPAAKAAGVIHSDFERGFIKAEVISFEDLMRMGGIPEARQKGLLRLEGKEYPVRDGDVITFRFNV